MSVAHADRGASHESFVLRETLINTLLTAVIAAALSWLLFQGREHIPALGPVPDGIFGIIPGTFNFTLLVTIGLTLSIRARRRRGTAPRLASIRGAVAALPSNVVARALALAVLLSVLLTPSGYGLVEVMIRSDLAASTWSFLGITCFFVVYFCLLSLIVTPLVAWRALAD